MNSKQLEPLSPTEIHEKNLLTTLQKKDYTMTAGVTLSKEPDLFTLDDNPLLHRGVMSCGHVVSPTSLTEYLRLEIDAGKCVIKCPYVEPSGTLVRCNKEWPYRELRKMACLTTDEKLYIEKRLTINLLTKLPKVVQCRECDNFIERRNIPGANKITCQTCTKKNNQTVSFCFKCLGSWTTNLIDFCGNPACQLDSRIEILDKAPLKNYFGTLQSPVIRACPKCGILIELDGPAACRTVACICGVKFCFLCLESKPSDSEKPLCYHNSQHNGLVKFMPEAIRPECNPKPTQTILMILAAVFIRKNLDKYLNL